MTKLYAYGIAGLIIMALIGAVYLKGRTDGAEKARNEMQAALLKQTQETLNKERENAELSKRIEQDLKPKLAAAESDARSLSSSLRDYRTRLRALSEAARTPAESDLASRVASDLEQAEADHFAACSRDAQRLDGWREFYSGLQAAESNTAP